MHRETRNLVLNALRDNPTLTLDASGGSPEIYNSMLYAAIQSLRDVIEESFDWEAPPEPFYSGSFPDLEAKTVAAVMYEHYGLARRLMHSGMFGTLAAGRGNMKEAFKFGADVAPALALIQAKTETYPEMFRWGWETSRVIMAGRVVQHVLERLGLITATSQAVGTGASA